MKGEDKKENLNKCLDYLHKELNVSNKFYLQIHLNKNKPQLSVLVFYLDLSIRKYNYGYGQVSRVDISACGNYLHHGSITCFCSKVCSVPTGYKISSCTILTEITFSLSITSTSPCFPQDGNSTAS